MARPFPCPSGQNNLIHTLAPGDRELVEPHLTRIELPERFVIDEADVPSRQVVFPVSGVGSMVAIGPGERRIEAGLFGFEGMSGLGLLTGDDRMPILTMMQIAGHGLAIEADRLRDLMAGRPSLAAHLLRFAQVMFVQVSHTALSNGHGLLEERLARWLLMCHDRIRGDDLPLTHDFIALMLGVRRAGVTVGTHLLEGKGLIRANRGLITVLDRKGLEAAAQGFYGVPEATYVNLFAAPPLPDLTPRASAEEEARSQDPRPSGDRGRNGA